VRTGPPMVLGQNLADLAWPVADGLAGSADNGFVAGRICSHRKQAADPDRP
jgi:hypothetical protein